jgi:hypothetical protein
MLLSILIAFFIISATVVIHATGMIIAIRIIRKQRTSKFNFEHFRIVQLVGIVLMMVYVSIVEVVLWAFTYLWVNAMESFEEAFYFSMVTFTTLGYGDIVLKGTWRLLASFEAATGIIMFGWTTAIVFAAVQNMYFKKDTAL